MRDDFDYTGLISQLEDHMKNPRFYGLLDNYNAKATCLHPDGKGKVVLTMQIEDDKTVRCGFEIKGCPSLLAQASLYLDSAFNATLSETYILAGNILKQIKDDDSKESRCSMLFLTAYKECVEAYYEKEKEERITTLTF
ncbi:MULTISPECIES: iron-sulfur cluster assembly scaffold protein [Sulfurospirillum]|uniref:Iron-sulfur cluster assembly scaffold protein n=4 Tax=Sulfurospirillum TaxID=57665 RepID=A0A6G9VQ02_9BACT|nr:MULTISPECIES: iron-sulfur cluster assembly scaffold protein [Sulfurospirillum]AHJ12793.1 IscU/NifU-like protein [Sulfurospirillum multivorans DSM 12446]AOO65272.1 IscU/NifU-like protein [Sulfurospirillum halorespirans DSM 13726]ARU48752.1 IscU/NifU-like protein [Sulfurospirillum diekertiae]ASC93574.1 IscU/NifU-like protein [Sulfurospirillum diekertiae]ATB69615.1 IscU/NifU-like protein [Sulfurospirillum diekertiae]